MLEKIIKEGKIEAKGIVGFYPCNSDDQDDIEVYNEEGEQ